MNKTLITAASVAALLVGTASIGFAASQSGEAAPTLTAQEAIEIALKEVPGLVEEVELEDEDGVPVFEIEIVSADGLETEVEIDALTGDVLEIESDEDEDGDDDDENEDDEREDGDKDEDGDDD